ncbi:phosphonate ABC transporter, permease protein PhnE [uncultured Enterovirga sp.]|uniref:phosphonate ABC transporter, permease protein PhnE n=1 Tax=uncultured Enterovirga sp. TaxID=2026352 RepID=UPI0035CB9D55
MTSAIRVLPERQAGTLLASYQAAARGKRQRVIVGLAVLAGLTLLAGWMAEVRLGTFADNIGNFTNYLAQILPQLTWSNLRGDLAGWYWNLPKWLALLGETILIAYLGTVVGAIGAFLLCFAASANLVRSPWLRFAARRYLEFCRTVPEVVFALIFVLAFGLGPVVGVMALAIHTTGALGKLFAEVAENIDMKPVEGIEATGASWVEIIRFAVLPQVLANFASYALLRFEINVRAAGVMGFVGAGGIGMEFLVAIRSFYYQDISAILLLIVVTVIGIDLATERLRHLLMSAEARH